MADSPTEHGVTMKWDTVTALTHCGLWSLSKLDHLSSEYLLRAYRYLLKHTGVWNILSYMCYPVGESELLPHKQNNGRTLPLC